MADQFSGICLVVSEPELRYTPAGKAIVSFRVKDGENFHTVAIWEPETWFENGEESWPVEQFQKGSLVALEGKLESRTFTKKDGSEGTGTTVTAYAVGPLWRRPRRDRE